MTLFLAHPTPLALDPVSWKRTVERERFLKEGTS
jgi:hypothetical protein